jgi:hypothetical protein
MEQAGSPLGRLVVQEWKCWALAVACELDPTGARLKEVTNLTD